MRLTGRTALITGGSRGLGASMAMDFAKEGAQVAVVFKSREDKATNVVNNIVSTGGSADKFQADVSEVSDCYRLTKEVLSLFGRIDILVNNAGIFIPLSIAETNEKDWDDTLNTNLKSSFFLTQAVLPSMKKNQSGKIINVSSSFGLLGHANAGAYCASKAGMINLTRSMCIELAPHNINVNSLAPGGAATDLNAERREIPEFKDAFDKATPSREYFMKSDGLSGDAIFLASSESDYVHGAHISVDGGWTAGHVVNFP